MIDDGQPKNMQSFRRRSLKAIDDFNASKAIAYNCNPDCFNQITDQIKTLQQQVKDQKLQIITLQGSLSKVQSELLNSKNAEEELQNQMGDLNDKLYEYEDQLDTKDNKISSMQKKIDNLNHHLAELETLNDQLQDVIEQKNKYAKLTEKSFKAVEYWKKTARMKEIEIQSMKINNTLVLNDNNDDNASSNSISQNNSGHNFNKTIQGTNERKKDIDGLLQDLQHQNGSEINDNIPTKQNKIPDQQSQQMPKKQRRNNLYVQIQHTDNSLEFDRKSQDNKNDELLDFDKSGIESEKDSPLFNFNNDSCLKQNENTLNDEFRERDEHNLELDSNNKLHISNSLDHQNEQMIFDEEQDAHQNDNSISNSMLLEIEYRTQNIKGNIDKEFEHSFKQSKVLSSNNIPQIQLTQFHDKYERGINTQLNLTNQAASQHSNIDLKAFDMNQNPLTQRIPAESEYNKFQNNSQQASHKRQRKSFRKKERILQKKKQSVQDSLVLNEILSNYGNKSKINQILQKNKQAKIKLKQQFDIKDTFDTMNVQELKNEQQKDSKNNEYQQNKKIYTRSKKIQVCEVSLGFKDKSKEVEDLRNNEQQLKNQLDSQDQQLEIEKQLNLQLNAKIIEQRERLTAIDRDFQAKKLAIQEQQKDQLKDYHKVLSQLKEQEKKLLQFQNEKQLLKNKNEQLLSDYQAIQNQKHTQIVDHNYFYLVINYIFSFLKTLQNLFMACLSNFTEKQIYSSDFGDDLNQTSKEQLQSCDKGGSSYEESSVIVEQGCSQTIQTKQLLINQQQQKHNINKYV